MIYSIPILQDTTIYESDPYRNTGLDQILELRKEGDISTSNLLESRILIKSDLSSISGILSSNSISINDISASLRLYTVQESNVPRTYTIEVRPIAVDWQNGTGYYSFPQTGHLANQSSTTIGYSVGLVPSYDHTDGATWMQTAGTGSTTWSSSLSVSSSMLYNSSSIGGGLWITGSVCSQSFSPRQSSNIDIDITSIVRSWLTGSMTNNGLILSFKNSEISSSNYPNTLIQFYSAETHTVNEPHLYLYWTGSYTYSSGSATVAVRSDSPVIYTKYFPREFQQDKKIRIDIGARPRYPRQSFQQNSVFSIEKALPEETYYQIIDAHSSEIIIPYSQFTKVNTISGSSYFEFYTTMLHCERYYKFELRSNYSGVIEYYNSNDYIFKIVL